MADDGSEQMQDVLESDVTIQGLVDSFVKSSVIIFNIFSSKLIPKQVSTDSGNVALTVKEKTINHFRATAEDGAHPVVDLTRQVSCRAYIEKEAADIQDAAFKALNRVKTGTGTSKKAFYICQKMPIIEPQDSRDNFNAPLNVRTITVRKN